MIANLDIGLVVANAGYFENKPNPFTVNSDEYIKNLVNINCLQFVYVFRILSEKLMKRPKRSGMLVTSSMAYARPSPGIACYSAVKKFATHMAQGLNLELAEKVDVMSYNPFGVATKLIKKDKSQAGGATITVEQAVEACFRDMGCND